MSILTIYGIVAGIGIGLSLLYCWLEMEEESLPRLFAAAVLWPITLTVLVIVGIKSWLPVAKPGELTRKQKREIAYQKQMLAIDKARNEEHERAMRIING